MKTKHLFALFGALVVTGMVFTIYFGIQPRPIPQITLSTFETPEVVVKAILIRLREEIRQSSTLFLGMDPSNPYHNEILMSFIKQNIEEGSRYDDIVMDDSMNPPPGLRLDKFSLKKDQLRFLSGLKMANEKHLRLLIIVPSVEASQMLEGSLINTVKKELKIPVTDIVFSSFPRTHEQEKYLSIPCNTGEEDLAGTARLGCMILQKSRGLYRKKMKSGYEIGLLDQVGATDYVFLLTKEL